MTSRTSNVESFISKDLHSLLFLEEFVFSRTKFAKTPSEQVEFADAVVLLGDVLLIFQIKERSVNQGADTVAEGRWFKSKVLRQATKQVRDTLTYLETHSEIWIPNERGHLFNLAASSSAYIIKLVIYQASSNLPSECRSIRSHVSDSAGLIHILSAPDYLQILRTLRVPGEVVRYFKFRESVLIRFADLCRSLPEPALVGHFIFGDLDLPPTINAARHLHRLIQDDDAWDMAPLLRGLHDHRSESDIRMDSTEYYSILIELAKLPRSAWRSIKERVQLCLKTVQNDEFARPYRITVPETNCGFVFIPMESEHTVNPNWQTIRQQALHNLTMAHKYDQRLPKCIGFLMAKSGEYFYTDWCLLTHEWVEDYELQRLLDDNFPFRSVSERVIHGYRFTEGIEA